MMTMDMPVITRQDLKDVQSLLGLADQHVECITLHTRGMTVKQFLTDEDGRIYWDEAFGGAAYVFYTVLLS